VSQESDQRVLELEVMDMYVEPFEFVKHFVRVDVHDFLEFAGRNMGNGRAI
jgi:hypothetical protein